MTQRRASGFSTALLVSGVIHAAALAAWHAPEPPPPPQPLTPVALFRIREVAPAATAPLVSNAPVDPPPPPPEPPAVARRVAPAKPKPAKKIVAKKPPPRPVAALAPASNSAPQSAPTAPAGAPGPVGSARGTLADPVVRATYESVLLAWLERYKRYPRSALRRGIVGRPVVEMRIGRDGRLLSHRLTEPSRHAMLDEAALAMVTRAEPFPPVPEHLPGNSFVYQFGVDFEIARR